MTRETLATMTAPTAAFERMVRLASLEQASGVYYDEMLVRVTEDHIETPAGKRETSIAAYCTIDHAAFDDVSLVIDDPATAIFDIDAALGWLEWLDSDVVEVAVLGDPEESFGGTLELRTDDETVRMACDHGPEVLSKVTMELPSRFEDDEFRLEDGSVAPTRVETTMATLERIADAVELAETVDGYPFTIEAGMLTLDVGSELSRSHAWTDLDADVDGDDVDNQYGAEFAAVTHALEGDVTIQTGPNEPLVLVQSHDLFTLRYLLLPRTW
jgi:hypothetical protein